MKRLIDAIIKKWFCCHEWIYLYDDVVKDDFGGTHNISHYLCHKCGKFKRIKS